MPPTTTACASSAWRTSSPSCTPRTTPRRQCKGSMAVSSSGRMPLGQPGSSLPRFRLSATSASWRPPWVPRCSKCLQDITAPPSHRAWRTWPPAGHNETTRRPLGIPTTPTRWCRKSLNCSATQPPWPGAPRPRGPHLWSRRRHRGTRRFASSSGRGRKSFQSTGPTFRRRPTLFGCLSISAVSLTRLSPCFVTSAAPWPRRPRSLQPELPGIPGHTAPRGPNRLR
mmetsp:Transcript_32542/g.83178  ORF Transcript_32542/g.83178 Transcript_32542/m.83178 type:complete len:226 (+) Transcript_32542:1241-1918(+)